MRASAAEWGKWVTADELALKFSAKKATVTKCLHLLTQERLIGHKVRSRLDRDGCWTPSIYTVLGG